MFSNRRPWIIVALAALLGAAPAPSPQPSASGASGAAGADAAYAALAKAYFAESFRANPVGATAAGIHEYDARLGSYGAADYAAQIARDHRYLDRLAALDPAAMSPRVGLDRRMLENALRDDLLLNGTMQVWKHQPDGYVQTAGGGVFVLISRDFAPAAVRMRAVIAREEQIPRLFAQARANLNAVDKDTASIAAEDAAGTVALLTKTVPQALGGAGDAATRARLRRATATAVAATTAFADYLKQRWVAHPSGTYAIGAANYSARLKYEEGIDMPLDRYLAIGEKALAQTHAELVATAKRIDPHATTEQVLARLYKVHPDSAHLMAAAQGDLVKLRAFVTAHHIIDLPPDANIKVTPTPEFLRATTQASMDSPGPLERVAKQAFYNVTPVDPHDPPNVQEQYLQSFNDFERPIISAHEVYPGSLRQLRDRQAPAADAEREAAHRELVRRRLGALRRADDGRAGLGQRRPAREDHAVARGDLAQRALRRRRQDAHAGHDGAAGDRVLPHAGVPRPRERARRGQARHAGRDLRLLHARQARDLQAARRLPQEAGKRVHPRALPPRPLAVRRSRDPAAAPAAAGRRRRREDPAGPVSYRSTVIVRLADEPVCGLKLIVHEPEAGLPEPAVPYGVTVAVAGSDTV
jgi:hypothetical protein